MSPSLDPEIDSLIQEVNEAAGKLSSNSIQDDHARLKLQTAALQLVGALDSPLDGIHRIAFQAQAVAIVRVGLQRGWFDALAAGNSPKTAAELAAATNTEELLLVRLMRVLVVAGVVKEEGPQTYSSTKVAKALTVPKLYHGIKHFTDEGMPVWVELLRYFEKNDYRMPTDSATGPFVHTFGMNEWDYFKQNPARGESFNVFMEGHREGQTPWLDVYPADERLLNSQSSDEKTVFLVDVGGGSGRDIRDVEHRLGTKYGRLILQDQPDVVAQAKGLKDVELVPYDFFTPQPIKGARVYYSRSIFHDWDDNSCKKILANQASAMTRGYSKLLLNEMVLPETKATYMAANLDVFMMVVPGGMERTRKQWHDLLDASGFKIVEIWQFNVDGESIIEAELK